MARSRASAQLQTVYHLRLLLLQGLSVFIFCLSAWSENGSEDVAMAESTIKVGGKI